MPYSGGTYKGGEAPNSNKLVFGEGNKSGVTIATGFDLGQHSEAEIRSLMGVDSNLIERLVKFAGKRQFLACQTLYEAKGLKIDNQQAKDIDRSSKRKAIEKFMQAYNAVAVTKLGKLPFENLHYQIRTAIMNFAFQYGEYGHWSKGATSSMYWKAITSQDFGEAKRILVEEYKTAYVKRRRREAVLYGKAGIFLKNETSK
ncbi:MAG: pesticin C-terminus-like muramidase [Planctomycetia bacterium]|nr:pesticin C-terminus-like muramidase [Planctomycetia bacterium]